MSGALILAAGFSRRFGADKRLHQIVCEDGRQRPMICATIRRYLEVFPDTRVVLRAEDQNMKSLLNDTFPELTTVTASDSHLGMGHSLQAGISAVQDWRYAFIGLADMPFIERQTLQQLTMTITRALQEQPAAPVIVQPVHDGQPGHPVGFSRHLFDQLQRSRGDIGARSVIAGSANALQRMNTEDQGILTDIDQPS